MVLLGQLRPDAAPPFAGSMNIVFLIGNLVFICVEGIPECEIVRLKSSEPMQRRFNFPARAVPSAARGTSKQGKPRGS